MKTERRWVEFKYPNRKSEQLRTRPPRVTRHVTADTGDVFENRVFYPHVPVPERLR